MKKSLLCLLPLPVLFFACEKPKPASNPATPEPSAPAAAESAAPAAEAKPPRGPGAGVGNRPPGAPTEGGRNRGQRMEQMLASLNLTADQSQKVQDAMASQRPAMEALRNDTTLSREQRREKMQALRQTLDAQLSNILSPEQKAKWDADRAQRRERGGRGGNNAPEAPADTNSAP